MPGKKRPAAPRQGDAQLRESDERYRTLTELVYRADPVTLAATFVNPAVQAIYGYSVDEWLHDPSLWEHAIHPDDRTRVLNALADAQRHARNGAVEYRVIRKDGSVRWVVDRFAWDREAGGAVVSLVGVMSDITERKQAEEARRESERKLTAIVENLPGFLYRCANTPDYPMEFISRGVFDLTGYRAEEFLSGTVMAGQITHPEDAERAWNDTQAGLRSEGRYQIDYRLLHRNGQVKWAWERGVGVYDSQHNLLALEGVVIDVTERKHAEEALRASEDRLRLFIEHAPAALAMFDRDMRYLAVSRRWLTDYGLTDQNVIGRSHYEVFPEIQDHWKAVHRRGLAGEVVREDQDRFERADGTMQHLWWEVRPWRASDGSIGGIVIFTEDVTERIRAEEASRESREWLARIAETDVSGIVAVDVSGTIVFANPAVERMAGRPPGSMTGRAASEIAPLLRRIDGRTLPEEERPFQRVMRTGRPVQDIEIAVDRPDGRRVALSVNAAPLRDPGGGIAGVVVTLSDITERVRAEAQVRGLVAALQVLASRVQAAREEETTRIARELHDELGQALTGLKMDLSWLEARLADVADERHAAGLREKSASMMQLIDATVQAVRRIATDLRPGLIDDLGLAAAIEWQAQEFQARTGITCTAAVPGAAVALEPPVATALYRILQEALTNVIRHAGATRVDVALSLEGASVVLDIRDDGGGIPAEAAASPRSIGLLGMRERARTFNGEVTIAALAPHGTRVHAEIPI